MIEYTDCDVDKLDGIMDEISNRICKLRNEELIPKLNPYRSWDIIYDGTFLITVYDRYDLTDCDTIDIDHRRLLTDFEGYRLEFIEQKRIRDDKAKRALENAQKNKNAKERQEFLRLQKIYGG